jgi:aminobenzoyl-glutamate transport protein
MLDGIETVGNRVPHPAIIFAGLCVLVIVVSALLSIFSVKVTYEVAATPSIEAPVEEVPGSQQPEVNAPPSYEQPKPEVHTETTKVESLLSIAGLRFIFSSFVTNFAGFSVVAVIFVAMIGVGVAEKAGLMAALIRKLVAVAPARAIAFIIVLLGVLSSVASDAGYLILIPLGAAAFVSLGRHPLAGLAAAYAGVSAIFAVNILITPIDSLVTEITNETLRLVPGTSPLNVTANLWFAIASTLFIALVVTFVTERMIEPRLGRWEPELAAGAGPMDVPDDDDQAALLGDERRGLKFALWGVVASIAVVVLLTAPPGAPLRSPETGAVIGNTPFMDSLIFIITVIFLIAGICYGWGARTINTSVCVIKAI